MPSTFNECLKDFSKCTAPAEDGILERFRFTGKKTSRSDIDFALNIVNQSNQVFSKKASDIRSKYSQHKEKTLQRAGIERVVNITIAAFRFLYANRATAGFGQLALEKTLSNFVTACINAHLGIVVWDGLLLLREWLMLHAEAHIVVTQVANKNNNSVSTTKARRNINNNSRTVRRQGAKAPPTGKSADKLAAGMRRLSLIKIDDDLEKNVSRDTTSAVHFPIVYCKSNMTFNNHVVAMLCNMLRVLSQDPNTEQSTKLIPYLAQRANSALDWCLKVGDIDSNFMEPYLNICFRTYYALGSGNSHTYSLQTRLQAIMAYAATKICDMRELLKYTTRAAMHAEPPASTGSSDRSKLYKGIAAFYTSIYEQIKSKLVGSTKICPELVDFCHHMALIRRRIGDSKGALSICQLPLRIAKAAKSPISNCLQQHAELTSYILITDSLIRQMVSQGNVDNITVSVTATATKLDGLAQSILNEESKHTLAEWNALVMCADIIRKTAKSTMAGLRQLESSSSSSINGEVLQAQIKALVTADQIYDSYIARGAAAKAESTGGTSVSTLVNGNAEICLLGIQYVIQLLDSSSTQKKSINPGTCETFSNHLLQLCQAYDCNKDLLRNHSTLFFNRGASLYQLKIYNQAAQAMEMAISSLGLWLEYAISQKKVEIGDVLNQLCKRYEIVAQCYQAYGYFVQASESLCQAVMWIAMHFTSQIHAVVRANSNALLPPSSSKLSSSNYTGRLLLFVDRHTRMCASRLAKDPSEIHGYSSILDKADVSSVPNWLVAWIYESEAYFWRPYITPSTTSYALRARSGHLQRAMFIYEDAIPLGYARCLIELAKDVRDGGDTSTCLEKLHMATEIVKSLPKTGDIYAVAVLAECYARQVIVDIEQSEWNIDNGVTTCTQLWSLLLQISGKNSIDCGLLGDVFLLMQTLTELLISRRMHSLSLSVQRHMLTVSTSCERQDISFWAPLVMESLIGLGSCCLLQGHISEAATYFGNAAKRYESGVLPIHVEVASKVSYAQFQLATGDVDGGAETLGFAESLAETLLGNDGQFGSRPSGLMKQRNLDPKTLVLLSRAAFAYSAMSLKRGELADAIDLGVHSYRILYTLLKSLSAAHQRAKREMEERQGTPMYVGDDDDDDDPFATSPQPNASAEASSQKEEGDDDADFIAFSGNWELQHLMLENLSHLAGLYSVRGSVKETDYFLKKGLAIATQLQAPLQEHHMRLREADILSRKELWNECANILRLLRTNSVSTTKQEPSSSVEGKLESVVGLISEGDSWRRSGNLGSASRYYNAAKELLETMGTACEVVEKDTVNSHVTPRLQRILSRIYPEEIPEIPSANHDATLMPLSIAEEDLDTRQDLVQMMTSKLEASAKDTKPLNKSVAVGVARSVDQQPEHLLIRANLAFADLQRMLDTQEPWNQILQSALVFPSLQNPHSQRPRKGTAKWLIKDRLAELESLLMKATESAITAGSAHGVHESCNLLAIVRAMECAFGLATADKCKHISEALSRIIDDSRNITVAREAVDALRRRNESMPTQLSIWPTGVLDRATFTHHDIMSGGLSDGSVSPLLFNRRERSPIPMSPGVGLNGLGDNPFDNCDSASKDSHLSDAVDGTKVVAGWDDLDSSRDLDLPDTWVVCGISIDKAHNTLLITRYQKGSEPLVLSLPMRDIDYSAMDDSSKDIESSVEVIVLANPDPDVQRDESVFSGAYNRLRSVIEESDKTMKTGNMCNTEQEKRQWWEHRKLLDKQLGDLLQSIESEWLGGFRTILQPDNGFLAGYRDNIEQIQESIQTCVCQCLEENPASKVKSMELSENLCKIVMKGALNAQQSKERGDSNDWLDICSMVWDIYCYQDAAVPFKDDYGMPGFANKLFDALDNVCVSDSGEKKHERSHLLLILDKHAQQIPWECFPCIKDYPISRIPSMAFLQHRLAVMKQNKSISDNSVPMSLRMARNFNLPNVAVNSPQDGMVADGSRVFYLLNPEGDLHRTQANFEDYLNGQPGWYGVTGRRPMNRECENGLETSDIFMYFGHGGAENYISRTQIRSLRRCGAALLFGCSSGQLKPAGEYDAMGTAIDYMIGGSPALVGNLWDVGDKDIDRFATCLLRVWGMEKYSTGSIQVKVEDDRVSKMDRPISLAEAVCEARKVCRMPFLTGAAPVVYGVPVYLSK